MPVKQGNGRWCFSFFFFEGSFLGYSVEINDDLRILGGLSVSVNKLVRSRQMYYGTYVELYC